MGIPVFTSHAPCQIDFNHNPLIASEKDSNMPTLVLVDKENLVAGEQQDQGFASWRKTIVEEHQRRKAATAPSVQQQINNFVGNFPLYTNQSIMGKQSQNCKPTGKKAKQFGAHIKRPKKHQISRMSVAASTPFIPSLHCKRCKLRGTPALANYKKAHHRLCPNKTENKKKGITATQSNTMRNYVDGSGMIVSTPKHAPPVNIIAGSAGYNTQQLHSLALDSDFVSDFKKKIDGLMDTLEKKGEPSWALKRQSPPLIILAVDLLLNQFKHRRNASTDAVLPQTTQFTEAMEGYYSFFPLHTVIFTFPQDTTGKPSPHYHCLAGQQIIYLDWHLAFPLQPLPCPNKSCNGKLVHNKNNFQKNKGSLFPIWKQDGSVVWAVIMRYTCPKCKEGVNANDGRLLQLLPAHVSAAYPVPPRYATKGGGFHLHKDTVRYFEFMLKTYANGDQCSIFMVRAVAARYLDKAMTYFSQTPSKPFPDFYKFMNKKWPPDGKSIRRLYEQAEYSPLQPYGYSSFTRYNQEIRSVRFEKGDTVAFDHTFAVVRAYKDKDELGMKCVADIINGRTGEIGGVWGVGSTKLSEVSHGLNQAKERLENASVVTTDTMPRGLDFWKTTFGKEIAGRLGLFHFNHRIVDTLDGKCEFFWECLIQLKDCIYKYHEEDWKALVNAVGNGLLGDKKLNEDELKDIRHSKVFKSRYDKFLRKLFHLEQEIIKNLKEWIEAWEKVSDKSDRKVFTHKTREVTEEQFKNVKYLLDNEGAPSYTAVRTHATHGLTEWRSNRAESGLEKFHELLAHFANVGCKEEYADALILRGTAEHNVGARWKNDCKIKRHQDEDLDHPAYMDNTPIFLDHSLIYHINQLSNKCGFEDVVEGCRIPEVGNQLETFGSTYCREQNKRNQQQGIVADTKVCICSECKDLYESPQSVARGSRSLRKQPPAASSANDAPIETREQPACRPATQQALVDQTPIQHEPVAQSPVGLVPLMHPATQNVPTRNPYDQPMNPMNFFTSNPNPNPHLFGHQCFPQYPYRCERYKEYRAQQEYRRCMGLGTVKGRPPHDSWCPKAMGFQYWHHR